MEPRPVMGKQKVRLSIVVTGVVALIVLLAGFASLSGVGLSSELKAFSRIIGISCIVASAFLFIIVNIASDLHYQSYLEEYYIREARYYHTQSMMMLQSIEGMLRQQNYPQQPPYTPAPYQQMPQQTQPQQVIQPEIPMQNAQPQQNTHHSEANADRQQYDPQEDIEADYKAQFMRPAPQKKKNSSPGKE